MCGHATVTTDPAFGETMASPRDSLRVTAALAFTAAALAWGAVAVRNAGVGDVNWGIAAAGLMLVAWGISAWSRSRKLEGEL